MSQMEAFQQRFLAHHMERLENILNHVLDKCTLPDFAFIAPYIYLQRIRDFPPSSFLYSQDPVLIFIIALKIVSNIDLEWPDNTRFYSIQSSFAFCLKYKFDLTDTEKNTCLIYQSSKMTPVGALDLFLRHITMAAFSDILRQCSPTNDILTLIHTYLAGIKQSEFRLNESTDWAGLTSIHQVDKLYAELLQLLKTKP